MEHWSYPSFVNQTRAAEAREAMKENPYTPKGEMESYHHMCRYNAGFLWKHPLLKSFDYYLRVEPGTRWYCDFDDPFEQMHRAKAKYGFTMVFPEYVGSC